MKKKYNEIITELTDKELLMQLYGTQIILLILSVVLSIIFFDSFSYWKQFNWFDSRIIKIGLTSGIMVVALDFIFMNILPKSYYDDGGLNERIFQNRKIVQIVIIASFAAFSEEMLFRGIIQSKLGLIWASLIFAVIHYRYLFNWFLLVNILVLSFFIGFIFVWTNNLAVTIVMHFIIDFLLGVQVKWKKSKKEKEQEGFLDE